MVISRARTGAYPPISDYGVVGDCHSAALISTSGSIDWWCPDRFDGPSLFGALLDRRRGGRFRVCPFGLNWSAEQRYLPSTNVLQTVFTTLEGRVRMVDFAPVPSGGPAGMDPGEHRLIRLVEGLSGAVTLEVGFDPRFDYGREIPVLESKPDGVLAISDSGCARLWCSAGSFESGRARLTVAAGEGIALECKTGSSTEMQPGPDAWWSLEETVTYWSRRAGECTYAGNYRQWVERSALALMLLSYSPTGASIAAVTTSLPQWIPGDRNADYRYVWPRVSAVVAESMRRIGYQSTSTLSRPSGRLSREELSDDVPRTVDGGIAPPSSDLDWLEGYEGCRPVRQGAAAAICRPRSIPPAKNSFPLNLHG